MTKVEHYYVKESVGIAVGFLLASLTHAGLCTLTHTPSPMGFLAALLGRPSNERPYLLIPVGYPAGFDEMFAAVVRGVEDDGLMVFPSARGLQAQGALAALLRRLAP